MTEFILKHISVLHRAMLNLFVIVDRHFTLIISIALMTTAAVCSPEPQRQTDVRRKIRDSWVDWDDHIQAWQRLSAEGQNIIAAIANTKLTAVYVNIEVWTIFCFNIHATYVPLYFCAVGRNSCSFYLASSRWLARYCVWWHVFLLAILRKMVTVEIFRIDGNFCLPLDGV